jgi:hypothetical protein
VLVRRLRNGVSRWCGCLQIEAVSIHGGTGKREFKIWQGMVQRCHNRDAFAYRNYGGRGIAVCKRWRESFAAFYADMGKCPTKKHSIDRIDNSGNYEPGNCRWASAKQQGRNGRHNRRLTHNGISLTVTEWAERIGVSRFTIFSRLYSSLPIEQVLSPQVDPVRSRAARSRR